MQKLQVSMRNNKAYAHSLTDAVFTPTGQSEENRFKYFEQQDAIRNTLNNPAFAGSSFGKGVNFIHFSDIHGDITNLGKIVAFKQAFPVPIDALFTGDMVKGNMERSEIKSESKFIFHKLDSAAVVRAPQAETVASFIRMHKGRSMIVCGDFNDIPLSYARRTVAKDLVDCYISTATGPGFTYHRNGMYVRIDNVMCTDNLEPYCFSVDKKCNLSDHYPVVGWVKWHGR